MAITTARSAIMRAVIITPPSASGWRAGPWRALTDRASGWALVSRARCSVLDAATQNRDLRTKGIDPGSAAHHAASRRAAPHPGNAPHVPDAARHGMTRR